MKLPCLIFCCLAHGALAVEVESVGHGLSAAEALNNAKTIAVEQVAGTFITGCSQVDNGRYHQRIDQYHSGRIRSYEILSCDNDDGLVVMRIRADVDPDKRNGVAVDKGADISPTTVDRLNASRDDALRSRKILEALDEPAQAYVVHLMKTSYRNRGNKVDVTLEGRVFLNPKWIDDIKVLAKTMDRPVDLGSRWSDFFWALSAFSAVINPALPGSIGNVARATKSEPETGDTYMACFGETPGRDVDECHLISHPLQRLSRTGRRYLQVAIDTGNGPRLIEQIPINLDGLLPEVSAGQKVYFRTSARERRFGFPGVLVYEKIAMPFQYTLTVSPETLQQGQSFLLFVEGKS